MTLDFIGRLPGRKNYSQNIVISTTVNITSLKSNDLHIYPLQKSETLHYSM